MNTQGSACEEAWNALDTMEATVTDWEASFLESIHQFGLMQLTPKQRGVLASMVDKYLDTPGLAAEVRGQQRLFT